MFPRWKSAVIALVCLLVSLYPLEARAVGGIDARLSQEMAAHPADSLSVIVTYTAPPTAQDALALRSLGIRYGVTLNQLPMAGVWATGAQINQIAALANVRSLYLNTSLTYYNKEATAMTGAVRQRTMAGYGFSGKGVGVAIVDSGIDGTHPDLPMGSHVVQNVKVPVGGNTLGSPFDGVAPPVYIENVADTDTSSGHGTHCAGIVGGLGTQSNGDFAGVAPGADLIGVSVGEGINILWALEGWDYVLTHRYTYNIRVVSNSWGTSGAYNPDDPVNIASRILHDNGLTVCFAAGNSGPGSNTINPYSVAPWVIGVAAGDKQGRLADFSSRGIKDDPLLHPTVTAPGVSIVSCRSKTSVLGALSAQQDQATLTPAQIPYYTHMDGTSMATPHVAGACALLLQANTSLTPDQIKTLLTQTATPMAGYESYQAGAGYLNILAGLDVALHGPRTYGTVLSQVYNAVFNGSQANVSWTQAWDPLQAAPQYPFIVRANAIQTDVFLTWDNLANTFNLAVTDPSGNTTATGSNLLAAVYGDEASLSFAQPAAGVWHTTVYGLKGQSTGTAGIGVPDTLHGTATTYYGTFSGLNDIAASPYAPYIRQAVSLRLMDSLSDGTFRPDASLTRGEAAKLIASDCEIRQNLLAASPFTDVSAALLPYVQAVTAGGAPIRDIYQTSGPIMSGLSNTAFRPSNTLTRAEMAMWLVRALGLEAQAQSQMNAPTNFTDDSQIPVAMRGYVVVASQLGFMSGFTNPAPYEGAPVTYSWKPQQQVTRGAMAVILVKWHNVFLQTP